MNLSAPRVFAAAALWLALGTLALTAGPRVFGTPALLINVRWHPDLTDPGRHDIERALHLDAPEPLGDHVWTYVLRHPSRANVRAIVIHPQVLDTHHVDRARFTPSPGAEWTTLGGSVQSGAAVWRLLTQGAGLLFVFLAVLGPASLLLSRTRAGSGLSSSLLIRAAVDPGRLLGSAWDLLAGALQRGIPSVSAEAAGVFRILFVTLVLALVTLDPVTSENLAGLDAPGGGSHARVVAWLARHPSVVDAIDTWLVCAGLLVIAGAATRASYAAFTLAFLAWATVVTARGANHATSALALTLLALLPSRWGDAISLDAIVRRRAHGAPRGPVYGYTVWMPGFALGVALAAAAWSKLREGPAWIANGTVKYHLMTDAHQAWVDWGMPLVESDLAAVAASAAVVVTEALLLTAAFTRSYRYRAGLAVASLVLFAGFALFQGVFWPAWWILFVSFLPWHRAGRFTAGRADTGRPLSPLQAGAVVLLLVQQLVVSTRRIEQPPLLSAYDMYSTTYVDMEDYRRHAQPD